MGEGCQMMDDFGKEVQLALMAVAFATLFVKWRREEHRRSTKIWLFDTGKQGITSISWHFLNVFVAWLYTSHDACLGYFILIFLDATLGVALCWAFLTAFERFFIDAHIVGQFSPYEYLRSGKYGRPPSAKAWAMQLGVWQVIVVLVKLIMGLLMYPVAGILEAIARFFLTPFLNHPHTELIVVMLVAPLFLNIITFWISDNILKSDAPQERATETELNVLLNPWAASDDDDADLGRPLSSLSISRTSTAVSNSSANPFVLELSSLDDDDFAEPVVMVNPFSTVDTR
ncbi:transmembrane protein 110 [Thecamonas trahens ATCC 50062]|uniref:Transmembrane protein 110 n=1 Tax=Thecamonas trahens ATCC 50062 TaxID=461836 RepID=A0A0L0D2Z2_THETB|nr:transmembrane protein 110 [Thecamonas trahens ATCC 50062]KNC46664.1 transmembrane protein 110 [Thecamonas trahens ATCC 50062]|eukprot:XP_013760436.1 transmembrane protein 110 [Thecamonas trahens ATCC 50062]